MEAHQALESAFVLAKSWMEVVRRTITSEAAM